MTRLRSGPLVAWANAWRRGETSSDEVLRAVTGADAPHRAVGIAGNEEPEPLSALLINWRRTDQPLRLVLPVAGDVRGLPGPAPFRAEALDAGEVVLCGGTGAWPEIVDYSPSSAPTDVTWWVSEVETARTDWIDVADAQYELTTAIRETASALTAADVAGASDEVTERLGPARRAGDDLVLPPGYPSRAVALIAQAQRLHAVLELAGADPLGGAVDRMGMAARASALAPLSTAVRRALLAGYNATAD